MGEGSPGCCQCCLVAASSVSVIPCSSWDAGQPGGLLGKSSMVCAACQGLGWEAEAVPTVVGREVLGSLLCPATPVCISPICAVPNCGIFEAAVEWDISHFVAASLFKWHHLPECQETPGRQRVEAGITQKELGKWPWHLLAGSLVVTQTKWSTW